MSKTNEVRSEFRWAPVATGPLPREGEFTIWVKGPITAAYLRHMRAQMDLVIGWLENDEEDAEIIPPLKTE